MSHLTLFLLLLFLSISFCECRIQPTKSNKEGKQNGLLHTIETIPSSVEKLNHAKKFDAIRELISAFRSLQILSDGCPKGFNLKFKVMRSGNRHKLLEHVSNEGKSEFKESKTVEELVVMDYEGAGGSPSLHNR